MSYKKFKIFCEIFINRTLKNLKKVILLGAFCIFNKRNHQRAKKTVFWIDWCRCCQCVCLFNHIFFSFFFFHCLIFHLFLTRVLGARQPANFFFLQGVSNLIIFIICWLDFKSTRWYSTWSFILDIPLMLIQLKNLISTKQIYCMRIVQCSDRVFHISRMF